MAEEQTTAVDPEMDQEMISFGIIAAAGQGRTLAYQALGAAKQGDFEKADALMEESRQASLEAHHQQTALLVKEANGEHTPVDVMLVHAPDHLMTSMLAQELVAELIELYRVKQDKSA